MSEGRLEQTYIISIKPLSISTNQDNQSSVYYKDFKDNWFRDNFSELGVFLTRDSLTLSQVLNEEAINDLDLDNDGMTGDTINASIANNDQGETLYKTNSGSYVIDKSNLESGDQTTEPTKINHQIFEVKF